MNFFKFHIIFQRNLKIFTGICDFYEIHKDFCGNFSHMCFTIITHTVLYTFQYGFSTFSMIFYNTYRFSQFNLYSSTRLYRGPQGGKNLLFVSIFLFRLNVEDIYSLLSVWKKEFIRQIVQHTHTHNHNYTIIIHTHPNILLTLWHACTINSL